MVRKGGRGLGKKMNLNLNKKTLQNLDELPEEMKTGAIEKFRSFLKEDKPRNTNVLLDIIDSAVRTSAQREKKLHKIKELEEFPGSRRLEDYIHDLMDKLVKQYTRYSSLDDLLSRIPNEEEEGEIEGDDEEDFLWPEEESTEIDRLLDLFFDVTYDAIQLNMLEEEEKRKKEEEEKKKKENEKNEDENENKNEKNGKNGNNDESSEKNENEEDNNNAAKRGIKRSISEPVPSPPSKKKKEGHESE